MGPAESTPYATPVLSLVQPEDNSELPIAMTQPTTGGSEQPAEATDAPATITGRYRTDTESNSCEGSMRKRPKTD